MYVDRLLSQGGHEEWGICGIGVMPGDAAMRDALAAQDYVYTLVEKSGDGSLAARRIGSICGFLYAPDDPDAVLALLTAPTTRIVSLTITEGGYNIDRATGEFDLDNPAVHSDIANPGHPSTVFGYITEALCLRRDRDIPPFTVMSCDNLPGNGHVARHAIQAYAQEIDPELSRWIEAEVAFPNSMVDRITPVTTYADRDLVRAVFGIDDRWPVMTEPFTQWVLEDTFSNDRPAFEQVGVQVVDDVVPYELMKLRLLNASHQAMAYIGMLRGHTYVHEATADPVIDRFLRTYLAEARVTLAPLPGVDLDEYIESLFTRFANAAIADTLARLAVDASDRIPKFVLPTIRDNLAATRPITMGATMIATWSWWLRKMADEGRAAGIQDPLKDELVWRAQDDDPATFVAMRSVFGSLSANTGFQREYAAIPLDLESVISAL
jgi:mannitol 2-dehydrogenase